MKDYTKINEIDDDGYFVKDYVYGLSLDGLPHRWTSDLVGGGYFAARYKGFSLNRDTGECSGGVWEETENPRVVDEITEDKINELMSNAAIKIAPLQDAIDLGVATEDEENRLKKWKTYRVSLMRMKISESDVSLPETPE